MQVSTASLSLLSKSLDHLDGNALDENSMSDWAASQIAGINKSQVPPEEQRKQRLHVKEQIDAAIVAFGKGVKFFTPKAFELVKPTSPLQAAKAKLVKQLEDGAETPAAKTEEADAEGEDKPDEAAAGTATTTKARPARKAAPEHIGKDFVEADETDPWPDAIGGSMADLAIGPGGKVYNRVK